MEGVHLAIHKRLEMEVIEQKQLKCSKMGGKIIVGYKKNNYIIESNILFKNRIQYVMALIGHFNGHKRHIIYSPIK